MRDGLHRVARPLADGRYAAYAYDGRGGPLITKTHGRTREDALEALRQALYASPATPVYQTSKDYVWGLIDAYYASPEWTTRLAESTRKTNRAYLERVREEWGEEPLTLFDDPRIVRDLADWRDGYAETPRAADHMIACMSRLFGWARSRGLTRARPTEDLTSIYRSNRSDVIWRPEDIDRLSEFASPEVMAAVRLAAWTGLRQGDLLRLKWDHVRRDEIVIVTAKKKRLARVPLIPAARSFLDALPRGETVLLSSRGVQWTSLGFRASFSKARNSAGLALRFHDLRGTAATRMRGAGLSNAEIALVMGWKLDRVDELLAIYVSADEIVNGIKGRLVPVAGIEPTTSTLQGWRSTN